MEENNTKQELSKFKKYLICLKKSWLMILILSIIGILLGLVIASKTYHKKYEENNYSVLNFRYKEEVSIDYNDIINSVNKYNIKSRLADNPTRYLCNDAYWQLLNKFSGRALLIHIPTVKYFGDDLLCRLQKAFSCL